MFFIYGGRGEILRLPLALQFIFQGFVVLVSTLWLAQIWGRTQEKYQKETLANFEDEPKANLIIAKPKVDERTQSRWTIERTERRHR
ncbi:MAG: hypothetical protein ACIWVG_09070 [Gloeotrichia echinulata HAB0833]